MESASPLPRSVPVIGGVLLVVGAFVPWIDYDEGQQALAEVSLIDGFLLGVGGTLASS